MRVDKPLTITKLTISFESYDVAATYLEEYTTATNLESVEERQ